MSARNKSAFTLMELLVVISIIALLHKWLAKEQVNIPEAQQFLSDPTGWASNYQGTRSAAIALANVPDVALVSDVVGVWGGTTPNPPSG